MSYEQTTNTSDRSTQVEEIITELANCRGVPPGLFRKIVCLADMAAKYQAILASKRKWKNQVDLRRSTANQVDLRRTGHIEEKKVSKSSKSSKSSKKVYMPDTFSPNQEWAMKDRGWDQAKAAEEAAKFGDYAAAHGKKYSNWDSAWRNWCRSPYQQKGNGNGTSAYTRQPTERERYGQFLHSLRSEGTNQLLAGIVSGPEAQRHGGNGGNVRRSFREISIGNRQNGSEANGHSNGSSDLFAKHRVPEQLAIEKNGHHAAEAASEIIADSYADD